jgi:hypothetical protein
MIIGSQAILYHFPDFHRKPKDVDIIKNMYIEGYMSDLKIEWLENTVLQNWFTKPIEVCTPNELYTLKISHCFWDLENGSWDKHIWDVQWLKEKGCKFIPELFYQLYAYWETIHGKNKRSNLNMSAEKFFDNVVNYPIEHDYLHTLLVQHEYFGNQNLPMYVKILKDNAEVEVSEEKFNTLTEKEKFNLVTEEVMVMALERFGNLYYKKAFGRMLKKFIISHAPIWEGVWIVMNHKNLLNNIPFDYISFLNKKISK